MDVWGSREEKPNLSWSSGKARWGGAERRNKRRWLPSKPAPGAAARGRGQGAEGTEGWSHSEGEGGKEPRLPSGEPAAGPLPPGGRPEAGGMAQPRRGAGRQPEGAKRAAGSAASPRGRARGLGGCVRSGGLSDPFGFRAVITGSQLGTTLPPRRLFPLSAG